MFPWEAYTYPDPRADPRNWNFLDQYTGPPVEGFEQEQYNPAGGDIQTGYGLDPNAEIIEIPPPPGYGLVDGHLVTQGPPPQPAYDPLSSAPPPTSAPYDPVPLGSAPGGTLASQPIGTGGGMTDFNTPVTGLFPGETYGLQEGVAPFGMAPPPLAGDPGYPVDAGYGYDYGYDAGGGYGYDAGMGYGDSGYGYDAGFGPTDAELDAMYPPSPRGFDPFLWAGVKNPMPPQTPIRSHVMQAGGYQEQAWIPTLNPPPAPQPPGPLTFVRQSLGLQPPGVTLENRVAVPGYRPDGTPKNEPRENFEGFVPADQMSMFPGLPPTMPTRRGY